MKIDSYNFGEIVVNGKSYQQDVILFSDKEKVFSPWWRKEGHLLSREDIDGVLKEKPDVLIIGCGAAGIMRVPKEVKDLIENQGIKLLVLNTKEACNKFNELASSNKKVITALHLTC